MAPRDVYPQNRKPRPGAKVSRTGLYSFASSIVILTAYLAADHFISNVNASADTANLVANLQAGSFALAALISILLSSVPSMKKVAYPNVLGLLGLIINVFLLMTTLDYMASYAW